MSPLGRRPRSRLPVLVAALLGVVWIAPPAWSQDESPAEETPDLDRMAEEVERAWSATLEMESVEAMWRLQAVSALILQESMLERLRALAAGVAEEDLPPPTATRDRVLARWRRERPADALPDLMPTFEIQPLEARVAATLPLLERHPDDSVLLESAGVLLRQTGRASLAGELLEGFLQRHPDREDAWRMLASHYGAIGNETRRIEIVARWAQRDPPSSQAVGQWLSLPAASHDAAATSALLDRFFASRPAEPSALGTCLEVARSRRAYREEARSCVARIAAGAAASPASRSGAEQAAHALAAMAGEDGDWDGLLATLDRLAPEMRRRALRAAASSVPAPAGCETRVHLLSVAAEIPESSADEGSNAVSSTASALRDCSAHPAARRLFVELVRTADDPSGVLRQWVWMVNGEWRGELPPEVLPILERRLAGGAQPHLLFLALDVAYQVGGDLAAHFELLRRWERELPGTMPGQQVRTLADYLVEQDRPAEAVALLERFVAGPGWDGAVAQSLWELLRELGRIDRAGALAGELLESDEELRNLTGHLLAGRGALIAGDLASAERHYAAYLSRFARPETALELLGEVAAADASATPAVARRLCAAAPFAEGSGDAAACAAHLLGRAGLPAAAAAMLAEGAAGGAAPDLRTLRDLAWKAQGADDLDLTERLRRQIVELDPSSPGDRVHLAVLLEKRGKLAELEAVVAAARRDFPQPPHDLLRAAGRAHVAAGQARRGIELLREARAAMPENHEPGYVDAELREAYAALGREGRDPERAPATPEELEAKRHAAAAGDVEAALAYAAATLTRENGGEPCRLGLAALEGAARAGSPRAAQFLGRLLYYGRSTCVEAEPARAVEWLRRAVEAGEPDAQYDLGLALLMSGLGEAAQREGVALLERAVADQAGHRIGAETLHLAYASGFGAPRDVARARAFAAEAARIGSDGIPILAEESGNFPVFAELLAAVAARLEPLAASGDAAAAGLLGRMVDNGWGVPHDRERALRLFRTGAEGGDAGAMRQLAWAYEHGAGVAQDATEAVRWWRRGAEAGDSFCMMFLAHALREGKVVAADPAAALAWLERSARAGNYWAIGDLGHLYDEGWMGVPRDERKAAEWKRRRAALGDEEARGWLAFHGLAVPE